jgi:hypothetical protein
MILGHAADELAPVRRQVIARFFEQAFGSAASIAIDDHPADLLRDRDEG